MAEEASVAEAEPAAVLEPVAEERPELTADRSEEPQEPVEEEPAELESMAGGAALMNADDLELPKEETETPDLEAQTAAQPKDEVETALITEPVEPQTEEEKRRSTRPRCGAASRRPATG